MNMMTGQVLDQYRKTGLQGVVEAASPHELIRMLMDGALTRIASAAGNLRRGEVAAKGENISRAIAIIEGLRTALEAQPDSDVAANLELLYDYMNRMLLTANLHNDPHLLAEVEHLLSGLRDTWLEVGQPSVQPSAVAAGAD